MNGDLIGSECWYRTPMLEQPVKWRSGRLLAWSVASINVAGKCEPVGILMDHETKRGVSAAVELICFASQPPSSF